MVEKQEDLLERDPIAEMEKILGKRHDQWSDVEGLMALSHFMGVNDQKNQMLRSQDDTTSSHTWGDYLRIAGEEGFIEVKRWTFEPTEKRSSTEYLVVMTCGNLLMVLESYIPNVNTANVYFALRSRSSKPDWPLHASGGYQFIDEAVEKIYREAAVRADHSELDQIWGDAMASGKIALVGKMHVCIGLRSRLREIRAFGEAIAYHGKDRSLPWLVSYRDELRYPDKRINETIHRRWSELPIEIRESYGVNASW